MYFLCASSILAGLIYGAKETPDLGRVSGVTLGIIAFLLGLKVMAYVWINSPPALARYLGSIFRWTPDGYIQTATTKQMTLTTMEKRHIRIQPKHHQNDLLLPGHAFAAIAMGLSILFYAILGFSKWWALSRPESDPAIPTLACILLLITLVIYLFSGIAFLLDRFRIPFVVPLILIFLASADWPESDHYFEVTSRENVAGSYPKMF